MNLRAIFFAGLCAIGLILSSVFGWIGNNISRSTDFKHYAYRPLVQAELSLKEGNTSEALKLFKIALTRAARCGRKGLVKRIRFRIANAAISFKEKSIEEMWCYYEYYVLTAENYDRSAFKVENWCMLTYKDITSFHYIIIPEFDDYTIWGSRFEREPCFTREVLRKILLLNKRHYNDPNISLSELFIKMWRAPIMVVFPQGSPATKIAIRGISKDQNLLIQTSHGLLDINMFAKDINGAFTLELSSLKKNRSSIEIRKVRSLIELIAQCKYRDSVKLRMELIREYEKM